MIVIFGTVPEVGFGVGVEVEVAFGVREILQYGVLEFVRRVRMVLSGSVPFVRSSASCGPAGPSDAIRSGVNLTVRLSEVENRA